MEGDGWIDIKEKRKGAKRGRSGGGKRGEQDEVRAATNKLIFSFPFSPSQWIHSSPLSVVFISYPTPRSVLSPLNDPFFLLILSCSEFLHHSLLYFHLQAWLTEIHEYAQQDVVVMLLGNKVRPCCQHWEIDGQMDS